MTPTVKFYARGYCFDLMQCEKILPQCFKIEKLGSNSVM